MLELLHIENIAVIESADISFRPGFNALTGETGAGKSIVIDAMSAVLGGRASRELIRTGADKAFVSAVFSQVPSTLPGLADNGVTPDEDGNLLLQREIGGDGKNVWPPSDCYPTAPDRRRAFEHPWPARRPAAFG